MPAGAGNPPNIKMEPPKSNFNIRGGGGGERFNIRGKGLVKVLLHRKNSPLSARLLLHRETPKP